MRSAKYIPKKKKGKPLARKEAAEVVALHELGKSNYEIGLILNRSHNTVKKYVESEIYTDPKFREIVEVLKEKEILDLYALNTAAKARLHKLAPKMNPIEAIALMDRTFQQRRLLEGKSTENISMIHKIIAQAHEDLSKEETPVAGKPVIGIAPEPP